MSAARLVELKDKEYNLTQGERTEKFSLQLKSGVKNEDMVIDFLINEHGFILNEQSNNNKFDFSGYAKKTPEKLFKFECKEDSRCKDTGNLPIEFNCDNRPSGIETSQSDFYIHTIVYSDRKEIYITATNKIKELISLRKKMNELGTKKMVIVSGGDNLLAKMYLFKKEEIVKISKLLTIISFT